MRFIDLINPFSDDCILRIAGRFLSILYEKGALFSVITANYFRILPLLMAHGLSPKILHSILAVARPDRTAVVDDHRSLTYSEINTEINQMAHFLSEEYGVGANSKVLIMMENRAEYLITWYALNRLNASPVHTSYGLKRGELTYQVEDSDGRVIVTSAESVSTATKVKQELDDQLAIVCVDRSETSHPDSYRVPQLENYSTSLPDSGSSDGKSENIVYTSGTTGDPKGASRELETPDELLSRVGFISEALGLLQELPIVAGDRQLIVTPIYHSWAQAATLIQMTLAGTVYLRPEFEAEDTLEKIDEWNINNVALVPTLIRRILDLDDAILDKYDTTSLNGLLFSAAPFTQMLREQTIEQFGVSVVHEYYGATELGLITHIDGNEMTERPGSVGKPLAGQKIKIFDDNGNELPPNEVGKIAVQNEEIMEGYLGKEDGLSDLLIGDWYTLEDLGYMDEDGYLYLSGRDRDMVITGGVNVYPVEIENTLEQHDSVTEIAVIGVPHEEWGEMLVAYVVPATEAFDPDSLETYARGNLHKAKVPKEWLTIDSLPRTQTGKVKKTALEDRYESSSASVS